MGVAFRITNDDNEVKRFRRSLLAIAVVLGLAAMATAVRNKGRASEWIRKPTRWQTSEGTPQLLIIETLGQEGNRLIGTGSYYNYGSRELFALVEGNVTSDGRFWPDVDAQVADALDGEWLPLGEHIPKGHPAVFPVHFGGRNVVFYYDLTIFRASIGRAQFGRVSLRSGERAMFRLSDLAPPRNAACGDVAADANAAASLSIYDGVPEPHVKPPFVLLRVVNSDHTGIFAYAADQLSVPLKGTTTPDGAFWPDAECQVSNDDGGVWRVIGAATTGGERTVQTVPSGNINSELRVDLDLFRPMIGRFRYGRIVISTGASAVFELNQLLPVNGCPVYR